MTCRDCIHYDVCGNYTRNLCNDCYWQHKEFRMSTEICDYFKDKSKYIELPCKVGDTVYYIAGKRIYKSKVHCISFGGRYNTDCGQIHIYDYDGDNASLKLSNFGKTIFLTKSEAEQKLKELIGDN